MCQLESRGKSGINYVMRGQVELYKSDYQKIEDRIYTNRRNYI